MSRVAAHSRALYVSPVEENKGFGKCDELDSQTLQYIVSDYIM